MVKWGVWVTCIRAKLWWLDDWIRARPSKTAGHVRCTKVVQARTNGDRVKVCCEWGVTCLVHRGASLPQIAEFKSDIDWQVSELNVMLCWWVHCDAKWWWCYSETDAYFQVSILCEGSTEIVLYDLQLPLCIASLRYKIKTHIALKLELNRLNWIDQMNV